MAAVYMHSTRSSLLHNRVLVFNTHCEGWTAIKVNVAGGKNISILKIYFHFSKMLKVSVAMK